jgi:hypothetical protein
MKTIENKNPSFLCSRVTMLHKLPSFFLLLLFALAFTSVPVLAQTTIVNFDFNSGTSYATLSPSLAANITCAANSSQAFATVGGIASGAGAFTANATAGNAITMSDSSGSNTKYFTFLLGGSGLSSYKTFKLYFQAQRSSTGAQTVTVQYSLNGGTFTTFTGNTMSPGNGSFVEATISLPIAVDNPTTSVEFRLFASGASGTGTLRIDNFQVQASSASSATITGAATASAFTTTYGTASAKQDFSISGANLTANLTATAGTGFEVASDGTTFGSTATFTQSGGNASGTVSVRLKASAAVSGTYNSVNAVVLSSTGATSKNITTAATGNSVTAAALSITASAQSKTYGSTLSLGTSAFTSSGLQNSETIGSVTLSASGGLTTTSPATTYVITPSAATGGTFTAGNYSITYNTGVLTVNPKALSITANNVTKVFGDTLSSPVTGSTAFVPTGLANSETVGSVTITYGTGKDAADAAQVYVGSVVPSAATGGTFAATNYNISYVAGDLTVTADPTITLTGGLSPVNTTYGAPSASPTSFSVSGIFLSGDLTVTPPAGYEVSLSSGSGYTTSLTIPASGTLSATTVFVRLAATTGYNGGAAYTGNISVSGGSATTKTIATAASTVTRAALTITGLSGVDKIYDGNTTASLSGTAAYSGLQNGETFSVTGTPSATFASAPVGSNKAITVTGYTAPSANYTLTQPSGMTANITAKALTITANNVTKKEGVALSSPVTGSTAFTSSGLVGSEAVGSVTITYGTGAAGTAAAGTYTGSVVPSAATGGTFGATNYTIT